MIKEINYCLNITTLTKGSKDKKHAVSKINCILTLMFLLINISNNY